MIWVLLVILVLGITPFLLAPLIARSAPPSKTGASSEAVKPYLDELDAMRNEPDQALMAAKTQIERQIVRDATAASGASSGQNSPPNWRLAAMVFLILILGTAGLYSQIGGYDTAVAVTETPTRVDAGQLPQPTEDQSLASLVVQLEQALQSQPDNVEGHLIYARALMSLQRFDEALAAYDTVYDLSQQNPQVGAEREQARVFVTNQRTAPEDRAAMIEGMVEGLAQKLAETPDDPQGWTRLIRARLVLGQSQMLATDVATMKTVYKDQPETINTILRDSGYQADTP